MHGKFAVRLQAVIISRGIVMRRRGGLKIRDVRIMRKFFLRFVFFGYVMYG